MNDYEFKNGKMVLKEKTGEKKLISDIIKDLIRLQSNCLNPCCDKEDISSDIEELIDEWSLKP